MTLRRPHDAPNLAAEREEHFTIEPQPRTTDLDEEIGHRIGPDRRSPGPANPAHENQPEVRREGQQVEESADESEPEVEQRNHEPDESRNQVPSGESEATFTCPSSTDNIQRTRTREVITTLDELTKMDREDVITVKYLPIKATSLTRSNRQNDSHKHNGQDRDQNRTSASSSHGNSASSERRAADNNQEVSATD